MMGFVMAFKFVFAETKNISMPESIATELYTAVVIPNGVFRMGCSIEQGFYCGSDEKPVHVVEISQPFYMMQSETTQELYRSVMQENPSVFKKCGSSCPVENLSWNDAIEFANALSRKEKLETCYEMTPQGVLWSKGIQCT